MCFDLVVEVKVNQPTVEKATSGRQIVACYNQHREGCNAAMDQGSLSMRGSNAPLYWHRSQYAVSGNGAQGPW